MNSKNVFVYVFLLIISYLIYLVYIYQPIINNQYIKLLFNKNKSNYHDKKLIEELCIKIELLTRSVHDNVLDLNYLIQNQLETLEIQNKSLTSTKHQLDNLKQDVQNRTNFILAKLFNISELNSKPFDWWLNKKKNLSNKIQNRIVLAQNPLVDNKSKKLICQLRNHVGFGSEFSHLVYCLMSSVLSQRIMFINSKGWSYSSQKGYQQYFKNFSKYSFNFSLADQVKVTKENPMNLTNDTIKIPNVGNVGQQFKHLPPYLPKEYLNDLIAISAEPLAYWKSFFVNYLFNFNNEFGKKVAKYEEEIFSKEKKPIVGLHIRRSDKLKSEASFIEVSKFMNEVRNFFDLKELINPEFRNKPRVVYLVTDDRKAIKELTKNYTNYHFLMNNKSIESFYINRYSVNSGENLLKDIYILSKCEFFVGTFSSNLGRLVFELAQSNYLNSKWRFKSMDNVYFIHGMGNVYQRGVLDHLPENKNEIELKKNDIVESLTEFGTILSNYWNGYSYGKNLRTSKSGFFPTYKVEEDLKSF